MKGKRGEMKRDRFLLTSSLLQFALFVPLAWWARKHPAGAPPRIVLEGFAYAQRGAAGEIRGARDGELARIIAVLHRGMNSARASAGRARGGGQGLRPNQPLAPTFASEPLSLRHPASGFSDRPRSAGGGAIFLLRPAPASGGCRRGLLPRRGAGCPRLPQ